MEKDISASDHDDPIAGRISEWANRLLQLDRRNNLLYFKPGRSAVGITRISPDELDERLRKSRRGLEFPYMPPTRSRRRGFAAQADTDHTDAPVVHPGDMTTDCEPADLQRRLRNLQRRDREWEEEQGLNVLFLAMGFLHWVDEDGEQARSPLLLIPCDLERESPRDPFRLVREDDDPAVNPTLRHQLARLGIELPEYRNESDEHEPIETYIGWVGTLAAGRADWTVDSGIFLGTFSYSKLAMYEDLTRMSEDGTRNELTSLLAGAVVQAEISGSDGVSPTPRDPDLVGGRLDDLLDLRDQYTVLPADFSQLRAIEEARRGKNLVIHGPPGTGKSQTIANLIATLLADGRRVLFVSEKTAALDVVKRRLEECNLGIFCLDLHSDRGRKSEVYRQLNSAVSDDRARLAAAVSIDELVARRDLLNRVVRLLHERREPLGKSIYEVQGLFAQVRDLPRLEAAQPPPTSELSADWIREAERVTERIERRPEEFRCHYSSRWIPLRTTQPSLQLADLIRGDMGEVQIAIDALRSEASALSKWLGVPKIESVDDARAMVDLLQVLGQAPTVPRKWLSYDAVARLRQLSRDQAKQQRERRRLEQTLDGWLGASPSTVDYRAIASALVLSPDERGAIEELAGVGWRTALGRNPGELLEKAKELEEAVDLFKANAEAIGAALADSQLRTLGQLDQASALTASILDLEPVPEHWLTVPATEELERESEDARTLLGQLVGVEGRLGEAFSDGLVERVDEEMLIRYRTDHQTFLRHIRGTYRRDQRTVRGQLKSSRKLSLDESLAAVELAMDVKRRRERWHEMEPRLRELLSTRFGGRETEWEGVRSDLVALRGILGDWRGDASVLRELLAAEFIGDRRIALESASQPLKDSLVRYNRAASAIGHGPLMASNSEVARAGNAARRAIGPIRRIRDATAEIYPILVTPPSDFDALTQLVDDGIRLMAVTEEDERLAPALAEDFGAFFGREATDWDAVSHALDWTADFLDKANGRVGDTLAGHAVNPQVSGEYEERAESLSTAVAAFSERLSVLDERFNVAATSWDSWQASPFADLEAWSADLRKHAGDAPGWVEYRDAVRELEERLGLGSAAALRATTDRAENAPGIVRRRIYAAWLEELYGAEPELSRFSRIDHEGVRFQFRELDERYPFAARQRVRERIFAKYPDPWGTPLQTGQLGILNGELSKRRRQMPVRRLIERIPNLLQTLKPCFLMSPLAVSQYLPAGPLASDHLEFDVVIFDEASQVLPEDAIPAIDRAGQVVVVGDRQQLPPTTFFRAGLGNDEESDYDEEEDEDSFEGRESILDVMVGQVGAGFADRYLSVHYRSRCESLIRFSNHAFYADRLLTFPSPVPAATSVRDEFLPSATYDAGRSRTNRDEAERVADLVFELMAAEATSESVGVVALSRPQADLIENLIDERRLLNRHLDHRFGDDLHERFFVKNLENVQGDERDHVILSIGYGPTPAGAVPNNFGPINRDGGERRLNVAVTRARKSMTVVHSLRPEDIKSEKPGARQLRRYLEYVRNPERAFEAEATSTGEPESPFEEAVLAALRSLGHAVDAQIGVSGYRIDLAIKSDDGEGYDLGIECDGVTYHSSPTARDRDWLRQQVLEGLGWHIHRVWSTAWVRDPGTEIVAIEEALQQARAQQLERPTASTTAILNEPPLVAATPTGPEVPPGSSTTALLFDEYRRFEGQARIGDLLNLPLHDLSALVRDIISVEQPVHIDTIIERVRSTYGAPRAGKRVRERVEQAIERLLNRPRDRTRHFLVHAQDARQLGPRRYTKRPIERVAPSEIEEGLLVVAKASYGIEQADLIRETARQFGWRRTGQHIDRGLSEGIERLLKEGRLVLQANMLVIADNGN